MDKNSEYGRIYSEICRGFSTDLIEGSTVYFKHPTIAEHFSTYSNYDVFVNDGRKKGLQLEEEKINEAIKGGWWTGEKFGSKEGGHAPKRNTGNRRRITSQINYKKSNTY